jgi:hypothetical protein
MAEMDVNLETKPDPAKPVAKKPTPLRFAGRVVASEARRFWYRITRENIAGFLWTLAWTIPITVFVWIYAESGQEDHAGGQAVTIAVVSKDPSKIVSLDPNEQTVMCDLSGPQGVVQNFVKKLSPTDPIVISLDTQGLAEGENHILAAQILQNTEKFQKSGVTIDACNPGSLTVYVDELSKKTLPVHAPPNIQGVQAVFVPSTVNVSGPSKIVGMMTEVDADIAGLQALSQTGTSTVDVSLLHDPAVTVTPESVKATLTVAEKNETYGLPTLAIKIEAPPDLFNDFSIEVHPPVISSGVTVEGPPEDIEQLKSSKAQFVYAVVDVSLQNVNSTGPAAVRIEGLPADVHVVGQIPPVSFTATAR